MKENNLILRFEILEEILWLLPEKKKFIENTLKQKQTYLIPQIIEEQAMEEYG